MKYEIELTDEQARAVDKAYPMGPKPFFADDLVDSAMYGLALAIRANPPKPPRMDEPEWQPQVIAHTLDNPRRRGFARSDPKDPFMNWWDADAAGVSWDDLIDPEPWRADA